jgi:TolB protein
MLAFVSTRSGNYDIWKIPAGGGTAIQVTTNTRFDGGPSWSPDGINIAFHSDRDNPPFMNIWTVSSDGGGEVQITDVNCRDYYPCWSPDSNMIAFQSDRSGNNDIWVTVLEDNAVEPVSLGELKAMFK